MRLAKCISGKEVITDRGRHHCSPYFERASVLVILRVRTFNLESGKNGELEVVRVLDRE